MSGKKALLAGAIFLSSIVAYNCGGGGGGSEITLTPSGSTLDLYVTDAPINPSTDISVLEATVYSVYLCESVNPIEGCINPVQIFSDPNGLTVDLTNLEDVLHFVDRSQVPDGTYGGIMVVVSKTGNVVYQGIPGTYTINPIAQDTTTSTRVTCDDSTCEVIVTGSIQPALQNKLAVDFDLKNFTIDCTIIQDANGNEVASCEIQKMVVVANPVTDTQNYTRFEMYGLVDPTTINGDTFAVEWRGMQFQARITTETRCEFEPKYYGINQREFYRRGSDCLTELRNIFQNQVCLELYVLGDPADNTQNIQVIKFDITKPQKCGLTYYPTTYDSSVDESESDNSISEMPIMASMEVKGMVSSIDLANNTFTLSVGHRTFTVEVTEDTYCEFDEESYEDLYVYGTECFNYIREDIYLEVKGFVNPDMSDANNVYITATKVEYEDYDDDDDYYGVEYEANYNSEDNYNGNFNDNENGNSNYNP